MKHTTEQTLRFYTNYPGWHSFAQDATTVRDVRYLESRGLLEVNQFNQARRTDKK